ncbi:MAG: hypothetical protein QM750_19750 [Rubrivivax sp.]
MTNATRASHDPGAGEAPPEFGSASIEDWHAQVQGWRAELLEKVTPSDACRALGTMTVVLRAGGVTGETAAWAHFRVMSWDEGGFSGRDAPSKAELDAAEVWLDAIEAAREALCASPPGLSESAFELLYFLPQDPAEVFDKAVSLWALASATPADIDPSVWGSLAASLATAS